MTRLLKYLRVTGKKKTDTHTHKHLGVAELATLVVCLPEVAGELNKALDVCSLQWSSYFFIYFKHFWSKMLQRKMKPTIMFLCAGVLWRRRRKRADREAAGGEGGGGIRLTPRAAR